MGKNYWKLSNVNLIIRLWAKGRLWKLNCKIRLSVILLMGLKSFLLKNTKWDPFELTAMFILPVFPGARTMQDEPQSRMAASGIPGWNWSSCDLGFAPWPSTSRQGPSTSPSNRSLLLLQQPELIQLSPKTHSEERHHYSCKTGRKENTPLSSATRPPDRCP